MKKILLLAAFYAMALMSYAQAEDFNETFPGQWIINKELRIGMYNNPNKDCRLDTGMITTPVYINTGDQALHLVTTGPGTLTDVLTNLVVKFDAFAFEPGSRNFNCDDNEDDFDCKSSIKIYVVPGSYTSTEVPTGINILGESGFVEVQTGTNLVPISLGTPLPVGTSYRYLVVGKTGECEESRAQVYVIDDISIVDNEEVLDFSESFPEGWDFNREFKLTQYCNEADENSNDIGIVTTPVIGNVTNSHLLTSPSFDFAPSTGTVNVSFDFFTYAETTRAFTCGSNENTITCNTSVKLYIVPSTYTGTDVPSGSDLIAQSDWKQLVLSNPNVISIPVGTPFNANMDYKVIAFAKTENCGPENAQVYLVDNIRIVEIERGSLPVTFTHFTAKRNKNNVELTWETAMEESNRGFHVQRNIDGTWKNIGFVFTQANGGNSSSALSYAYNDVNTSRGISQYRLLQVDHDNKGRYSEVRSVRGESQQSRIMVYPNPSNTGNVNIMFEDANSVRDVIVSDVAGRVVKQYRNVNTNTLTIENLSDGYYTIQIANRTTTATTVEKVIIKKR